MTSPNKITTSPLYLAVVREGVVIASELAGQLGISEKQLAAAAGLDHEAMLTDERDPQVQQGLHDLVDILSVVSPWARSIDQAFAWYQSEPIPSLGRRTAEELVKDGKAKAVQQHLDGIAVGGYA